MIFPGEWHKSLQSSPLIDPGFSKMIPRPRFDRVDLSKEEQKGDYESQGKIQRRTLQLGRGSHGIAARFPKRFHRHPISKSEVGYALRRFRVAVSQLLSFHEGIVKVSILMAKHFGRPSLVSPRQNIKPEQIPLFLICLIVLS
jgi:hypothetical protein